MAGDGSLSEDAAEYKKKYELSENKLVTLKKLSHKAIGDYEDLQRKYDQNQKQYEELKTRLQETQDKLESLQRGLEPAVEQFQQLNSRLEIEAGCRLHAENMACQMVANNKKLKRQSQMLLNQLGTTNIDIMALETISLAGDNEFDAGTEHINQLNHKLEASDNQLEALKARLCEMEEERDSAYAREKKLYEELLEKNELLNQNLRTISVRDTALQTFKSVSEQAVAEYEALKSKYECEFLLKEKAEEYASKMHGQCDAIKRESSILLSSAMSDTRLMEALLQVEDLSMKLETEKRENNEKIKALEETIAQAKDVAKTRELQTRADRVTEQLEQVQKQLEEQLKLNKDTQSSLAMLESFKEKLKKENVALQDKLDVAHQRLIPPPPPPPPPPPANIFKLFTRKKPSGPRNVGQKTPESGGVDFDKALKEMMDRINTGTVFKSKTVAARRPSLPSYMKSQDGTSGAMDELAGMVAKLGRSHSFDGQLPGMSEKSNGEQNDLMKTFNRIVGPDKGKLSLINEESCEEREVSSPKASNRSTSSNSSSSPRL